MKEKDFQSKFNRYLKYKYNGSAVFELKITKDKSIPFSAVKEHQILALLAVKKRKLIYKLSDEDRRQKPFDCFCLSGIGAYIVIMFYKRGQKTFYIIDIDDFLKEKKTSARKSLTEDRAHAIGKTFKLN